MSLTLLAPYALKKFQSEFGDYLRSQRQSDDDSVPNRVGKIYQDLIFNNVCGFLNQCFPICKRILGDDWRTLCLYFFQRYPTHSPYFTEIPMQFVEFLSQLSDDEFDKTAWSDELTLSDDKIIQFIPQYLPELAHYEWLELYVETLPNAPNKLILDDGQTYFLNHSIQNHYYHYPVQNIGGEQNGTIEQTDTCLVVLRKNDRVKFVEVNVLTHLFLDFLQNSEQVYHDGTALIQDFAQSIDYADVAGLLAFKDDLFAMLATENMLLSS